MVDIGRVCVKIAGRDAGKKCVVIDVLGKEMVMIEGETRRRKCNVAHIEPLDKKVDIKKGASHEDVMAALKSAGLIKE
jgi:large subunit ribosomal protein L14e